MYNGRQNWVKHFALKGLSNILVTSKGENKAFSGPSTPCNVAPLFKFLSVENNKHPNFE